MKIEKKNLPKSEVEFTVALSPEELEVYRSKAFTNIQKSVEIDGFRKGNVPEDIIVKHYGDMIILEEMANLALRDVYMKAIDEHKINPVAEPTISVTKLAKGNPFEVTITVPVLPEVVIPDYKKVAIGATKDEEKVEVTEKDVDDVIEELRKGRATQHNHELPHDHDHSHDGHDHHDHEGHDHAHDHEVKEGEAKVEPALPPLDDDFAKSFGDTFTTVQELKAKIKENLQLEKEQKAREKRRMAIMEKLVAESKADLPDALVESELTTMLGQMKADITKFGGTWEDYLAHSKKTEDEIKKDWRNDAVKRSMSQLILHKIAEHEKLQATDEEIEVELVRLMAQIQDADENRAKAYLYQALTNEKVLKFLEESK